MSGKYIIVKNKGYTVNFELITYIINLLNDESPFKVFNEFILLFIFSKKKKSGCMVLGALSYCPMLFRQKITEPLKTRWLSTVCQYD